MDAFYVIIVTLLVYVFLGTLTDVLIAMTNATPSTIMIKVFFRTFAAPITLLLLIFVVMQNSKGAFNLNWGAALIIGNLLKLIFDDRKYLVSLHDNKDKLEVAYLTPRGKRGFLELAKSDLGEINIGKANWLINYPVALNITYRNDQISIYIINKEQKQKVQSDIQAANNNSIVSAGDVA